MLKQNYHSQIRAIKTAALSNKLIIIVVFFVFFLGGGVVLLVRLKSKQLRFLGTTMGLKPFIAFLWAGEFLCLVLVELEAKCYRAYVCVRNTCYSCNMS